MVPVDPLNIGHARYLHMRASAPRHYEYARWLALMGFI